MFRAIAWQQDPGFESQSRCRIELKTLTRVTVHSLSARNLDMTLKMETLCHGRRWYDNKNSTVTTLARVLYICHLWHFSYCCCRFFMSEKFANRSLNNIEQKQSRGGNINIMIWLLLSDFSPSSRYWIYQSVTAFLKCLLSVYNRMSSSISVFTTKDCVWPGRTSWY